MVEACGDGRYDVTLQDFYLPHLKINPVYRSLASSVREREAKTYLNEKLKEAESLIDGINFRHATLYKVACCVVQMQVEFFERGYDCLRPLTMAQVAEAAGVSESTVSRVSNGNYMQTPRGVFELRFFFCSSAYRMADRVVSSVSVKKRIQRPRGAGGSEKPAQRPGHFRGAGARGRGCFPPHGEQVPRRVGHSRARRPPPGLTRPARQASPISKRFLILRHVLPGSSSKIPHVHPYDQPVCLVGKWHGSCNAFLQDVFWFGLHGDRSHERVRSFSGKGA